MSIAGSVPFLVDGVKLDVHPSGYIYRDGYSRIHRISITISGVKYKISRIVYSALVSDIMRSPGVRVLHIDGDKTNNNIQNLKLGGLPKPKSQPGPKPKEIDRERAELSKHGCTLRQSTYTKIQHVKLEYRKARDCYVWVVNIYNCIRDEIYGGSGYIPELLPAVPQEVYDMRTRLLDTYYKSRGLRAPSPIPTVQA